MTTPSLTSGLSEQEQEAYDKWAFTPYTGPLWNFKDATLSAWKAARDYYTSEYPVGEIKE